MKRLCEFLFFNLILYVKRGAVWIAPTADNLMVIKPLQFN